MFELWAGTMAKDRIAKRIKRTGRSMGPLGPRGLGGWEDSLWSMGGSHVKVWAPQDTASTNTVAEIAGA